MTQVINPQQKRCADCKHMACKVYYSRTCTCVGFCSVLRATVQAEDACHLPRLPPQELNLFTD